MFSARYHGTAFSVLYSNEPHHKTPVRAHVITSSSAFELISADWTTPIQKFEPADIASIDNKKTSVVLTMSPGSKITSVTLSTKPFPSDALANALTVTRQAPGVDTIPFRALAEILPTFALKTTPERMAIHKGLMDASSELIQLFSGSTEVPPMHGPLVDALTCLYRMRYRSSEQNPADKSVADTALMVKRRVIVLWCDAIARCARPSENDVENAFHERLCAAAAHLAANVGHAIGVDCNALVQAAVALAEAGQPGTFEAKAAPLEAAARAVQADVGAAFEADLAAGKPCGAGHVRWALDIVVALLAAVTVKFYPADIAEHAERLLAYTGAAFKKSEEKARKALLVGHDDFLKDLLGFLDGLRFEEKFQFIFCIWGIPAPELGVAEFD
jgi:hypothetical protein